MTYSMPLGPPDLANFSNSEARRAMMPFWIADTHPDSLAALTSLGAAVTLRIEDDYRLYSTSGPDQVNAALDRMFRAVPGLRLDGVIVGNEPEREYDWTWESEDWGNRYTEGHRSWGGRAYEHAVATSRVRGVLQMRRIPALSAAWSVRRKVPRTPGQPGRGSWYRICADQYDGCDGNCVHLYLDRKESPEDENRLLWQLGNEEERCHKPIWITEVGIRYAASQVAKMLGYMDLLRLILDPASGHDTSRFRAYAPFVCNAAPGQHQDYVISDPSAYYTIGTYLSR